jgi:hypothetical protein
MANPNYETERVGLRYGYRVVEGVTTLMIGETKYRGLIMRCDCGNVSVVQKSHVVNGRANKCDKCVYLD